MSNAITRLLDEKKYLLADGATGTSLFGMGLQTGDAPEFWNADFPDRVTRHYQSFIDAGSDIILTNTFGGNRYRLKLHNGQDRVTELNERATQLLRDAVDKSDRTVLVAGDIGPTGEIFEPTGTLSHEAAAEAFSEQAQALANGGADLLWIETLSSIEEARAAFAGARSTGLPIIVTMSIDTNGRTMMGVTAADIVNLAMEMLPDLTACGSNCGVGAAEVVAATLNMRQSCDGAEVQPALVAKANCGIPEWVDGSIVYNGTPELMGRYAQLALDSGAQIIGGCCGTTPDHIRAMKHALEGYEPGTPPDLEQIVSELGEVSTGAQSQLRGDMSVAGGSVSGGAPRRRRRSRRAAG
jgi:5-methyltetrahydrofolate--homocysteine methyltransferase